MFEEKTYITRLHSVVFVPEKPANQRYRFGPCVPTYELVYKLSGEAITHFNGVKMHNVAETIEFLPKTPYADYFVDILESGTCIDVFFDTDFPMPKQAFSIDVHSNKTLKSAFEKLLSMWTTKQDYYKCVACVYEILAELTAAAERYLPSKAYQKIERGVNYLHEHYLDERIDYYAPAVICNISYSYFKRLFVEKFSIPPVRYVQNLKLERAAELLTTRQYKIGEIAEMCGFESPYYFSRAFKKRFGVAPKFY